ncbi:MAG: PhzF family phenazine biosynthesis protein [Hamadaea sp.]|nr:PhzF family phenazine biosynthesis protein [Hamadaea sp.]
MEVTIVDACLRDGAGGSPTAVLADEPFTEDERRAVPVRAGTSHAVFTDGDRLRFYTSEGELPGCGHGTVAALAVLPPAQRLRAGGRTFRVWTSRDGDVVTASFDPGPVRVREATEEEREVVTATLGRSPLDVSVAALGRPRLLVTVDDRATLAALRPDLDLLRDACARLDLLGCYVHTPPVTGGRLAARMFAPAIGVPEDIANANSTACLAAHLAVRSGDAVEIAVDMGDALGHPATVTASADPQGVRVGGATRIARTVVL